MSHLKLATLFSGIGAPEQAAFRVYDSVEIVFACEWDKFARESYLANYDLDEKLFFEDVIEMLFRQIEKALGGDVPSGKLF